MFRGRGKGLATLARSLYSLARGQFLYPCRCLCFGFLQIMKIRRERFTTLQLLQIFFTDARTFMPKYTE